MIDLTYTFDDDNQRVDVDRLLTVVDAAAGDIIARHAADIGATLRGISASRHTPLQSPLIDVTAAEATLTAWDAYGDVTCDELAARLAEILDAIAGKPPLHAVDDLEASRRRHPTNQLTDRTDS